MRVRRFDVLKVDGSGAAGTESDRLAIEEPLEIQLRFERNGRRIRKSISITMRTPGDDFELAAGFLFGESIIETRRDIERIEYCGRPDPETRLQNVVAVDLAATVEVDLARLERHFYTTSSCGVCGKASIDALASSHCPTLHHDRPVVGADVLRSLPALLRANQQVFDSTGGLHAAGLFDPSGRLESIREDVGRHNAVDKVIGERLIAGDLPLLERVLLVSGRASFELVQKAARAGIPVLAAVGAPSSLAVELAASSGMTLAGFLSDQRFNVYSGEQRVRF